MIEDRPAVEVVSKAWGFEKRIVNNDKYCGKLHYIVKGKHTPLHYHKVKDETFFLHSGKLHVFFFDAGYEELKKQMAIHGSNVMNIMERAILKPGDNFYVPAGRINQMFAAEDVQLYEFSAPHTPDGRFIISTGE
ncbi:hypothetical protein LCGC14_1624800 [marine sediment metagenome]|uniref:Uncharacterized protein n=1 Tax=marine sediment metagenome TaxID=412755 RepID=A0A0F9KJY5_9ZZZZ